MDFDWVGNIRETLESTYYCSLATYGPDGAWVSPVYFAFDGDFNLYFISMPASRHMQNIGNGAPVAVAIYSTDQAPGSDVRGVQLSGWAQLIEDDDVEAACDIYYGRTGASEAVGGRLEPSAHRGPHAVWRFVKIAVEEMYYFDTRYFDEVKDGRQLVPLHEIRRGPHHKPLHN